MFTTNHVHNIGHCGQASSYYENLHNRPNQKCCPYLNYCFYMNNQMYYKSVNMERKYNDQTNNTRGFIKMDRIDDINEGDTPYIVEVEDSNAILPNIYKFKNNFNVYLQKNKYK